MENNVENNDQTVTFNEVEYKYSDLPDTGKITVNQLNILEKEILETRMLLDRHMAAKQSFITQFGQIVEPTVSEEGVEN
jgi:hypothetical protein